jgi:hypothetical protein
VRLTPVQSSIVLALGMQRKTIEDAELCLPTFFFPVRVKLTVFNRRGSTYPSHRLLHYLLRLSEKYDRYPKSSH